MDAGGAYVLVCTGVDLTVPQRQKAQELLEQNFKEVGYAGPRVDVSSQNQLIGTLRSFPSLSLHVNGRGDLRFQTLKIWSEQDQMRTSLKTAQPQQDFIDGMREGLVPPRLMQCTSTSREKLESERRDWYLRR